MTPTISCVYLASHCSRSWLSALRHEVGGDLHHDMDGATDRVHTTQPSWLRDPGPSTPWCLWKPGEEARLSINRYG